MSGKSYFGAIFRIAQQLNSPYAVRPFAFELTDRGPALFYGDEGASSLKEVIAGDRLTSKPLYELEQKLLRPSALCTKSGSCIAISIQPPSGSGDFGDPLISDFSWRDIPPTASYAANRA